MTEKRTVEMIARQLCTAAGKNPDRTVHVLPPLASMVGGCTVIKLCLLPAWKEHLREAHRIARGFEVA